MTPAPSRDRTSREVAVRRVTGWLFVITTVLFAAAATVLSSTFDWPDILREQPSTVLTQFDAGGTTLGPARDRRRRPDHPRATRRVAVDLEDHHAASQSRVFQAGGVAGGPQLWITRPLWPPDRAALRVGVPVRLRAPRARWRRRPLLPGRTGCSRTV
jgi:hypothetical protein